MSDGVIKQKEDDYKNSWEQLRWLAYVNLQPHLSKTSRIKKPTDLIKFSWEHKKKLKAVDLDQIKELEKLMELEGKVIKDGFRRFTNKSRN